MVPVMVPETVFATLAGLDLTAPVFLASMTAAEMASATTDPAAVPMDSAARTVLLDVAPMSAHIMVFAITMAHAPAETVGNLTTAQSRPVQDFATVMVPAILMHIAFATLVFREKIALFSSAPTIALELVPVITASVSVPLDLLAWIAL